MKKINLLFLILFLFCTNITVGQNTEPFPIKILKTEKQREDIRQLLGKIHGDDQYVRKKTMDIKKSKGKSSKEYELAMQEWRITDSINLHKLTELITTFGFDTIVKYGADAVFFVIQHASLSIQQKYFANMQQAVQNGYLEPSTFAMLEDRMLLAVGKKQIYGTQLIQDPKDGTYYVRPIENLDILAVNRLSVGLLSMREYCAFVNIKWSVEYYNKNLQYAEQLDKLLNSKDKQ